MSGTIFQEWRNTYFNNTRRLIEVNTIEYPANAVGVDTELYDLPNFNSNLFMLRFRFNLQCTDTNLAGAAAMITNAMARLFDVHLYTSEGKKIITLQGNGGIQVVTGARNPLIAPGDIRLVAEPFIGDLMNKSDRLSGFETDNAGTADQTFTCEVLIPWYQAAGESPLKYQLTWRQSLQIAGPAGGTIFAANGANIVAATGNVEVLCEMIDGVSMTKYKVTNPQTIGLVVGDNYLDRFLNQGQICQAIILQSPLPANVGDIELINGDVTHYRTEFDDVLDQCASAFPYMPIHGYVNYRYDDNAAAMETDNGFYNTVVLTPEQFAMSVNTNLRLDIANAPQNMRLIQITTGEVSRPATRPEVVSTAPAVTNPVRPVRPAGGQPTMGQPQVVPRTGLLQRLMG